MEKIIDPIDKNIIKAELKREYFLRNTNFGKREIYVITDKTAPHVMQEIGRLREISFRESNGGTGKSVDIDEFDISENPYKQLIVWDTEEEEIVGGYRFLEGNEVAFDSNGMPELATTELFNMSEKFVKEYLPLTIELGRSFIQPHFQSTTDPRRGMFSLDNLWDGLGALVVKYPNIQYFFGKLTMYTTYNVKARDIILYFMKKYFPDNENLVMPIHPVLFQTPIEELEAVFTEEDVDAAFKEMNKAVRANGENIPPLISAYIKLSSTMKSFGTAVNEGFGGVEETGILIKIDDIYEAKKERHIKIN